MHNSVEGNQYITVGGNRNITTGGVDKNGEEFGDVKELIYGTHNLHVKNSQRIKIENNAILHVQGNIQHNADGWVAYYIADRFAVNVGEEIVVRAAQQIQMTVGGNGIVINEQGVQIVGLPSLGLNSSALVAWPVQKEPPVDPHDPDR